MGLLFSCCRRRDRSSEREPLLPKHRVAQAADAIKPTEAQINKFADVIGALKAGKLPSQAQTTRALRMVLDAGFLDDKQGQHGYGPLSEPGMALVQDVRAAVEALLQFNLEKNSDNVLQDLFFQFTQMPDDGIPLHADVAVESSSSAASAIDAIANEIPSEGEVVADTATLLRSLNTLMRALLTSSAFRALLTELVALAKDLVGDTAVKVERTAEVVQNVAQAVGDTAKTVELAASDTPEYPPAPAPAIPHLAPVYHDGQSSTSGSWDVVSNEDWERMKTMLVKRLQEVMRQAQADPASRKALITIIVLLRKYASKLESASSLLSDTQLPKLVPTVWADPSLAECLSDLKILLSRMASHRPLEPFNHALYTTICDLIQLPLEVASDSRSTRKVRELVADLGDWFDSSLSDARYATSPEGRLELEELYDRARALIDEATRHDAPWVQHVRVLINESDLFVTALTDDATTNRLLSAISTLSSSFSAMARAAVAIAPDVVDHAQKKVRAELRRDLLRWFLPRIIRALRVVPMPRLEYTSTNPDLDVAVDALYLTPSSAQASLVPDHIRVCNYSEVQLDVLEAGNVPSNPPFVPTLVSDGMRTCTRLHVYVDGVRLSARDIGYYVSWRAFRPEWLRWVGYEDQGLVSLDVGRRGVHGDGLSFDFELEYISDSEVGAGSLLDDPGSLFRVRHVHATLRGLQVSLDRSKHWILNKLFLQPLAGPVGSFVAGWVLRRQLQALLESLGRLGIQTKEEAEASVQDQEKDAELPDYAAALWRVLVGNADVLEEEECDTEDTDETPLMDTRTRITAMGIVRESATHTTEEDADISGSPRSPVEESVLAVGIGAQILPGKGGPYDEETAVDGTYEPRDMAREGLDEVQSRLNQAVEAGHEAIRQAAEIRDDAEIANEREQQREGGERRRRGWRSRAFDL